MIKFRMYYDKEKKAQWLNKMAAEGWALKRFFAGLCVFEPCEKGKYQYQIDLCDKPFHLSSDYREFMADNEIDIVQTWGFWAILRKEAVKGDFVLFTDVDSQIEQNKKINMLFRVVSLLFFLGVLFEVYCAATLGTVFAWSAVFIVMAATIVMVNQAARTQNVINELEERKTGIKNPKKANISVLLVVGLLFNSCALLAKDGLNPFIILSIQVLALIFMLAGVIDTGRVVKKDKKEQ